MTDIAGYAYGAAEVARSPVSLAELEELKQVLHFGPDDVKYLRLAGEVLEDQAEDVVNVWYTLPLAPFMASTFASPDGTLNHEYIGKGTPRVHQWVRDTCLREYDQQWLDYQHEIGLRHHRTKKNQTDGVDSASDNCPYRWMIAVIYPLTTCMRPFLAKKGHSDDDVEAMVQAWTKSLILQVTLWTYPYVKEGDW